MIQLINNVARVVVRLILFAVPDITRLITPAAERRPRSWRSVQEYVKVEARSHRICADLVTSRSRLHSRLQCFYR